MAVIVPIHGRPTPFLKEFDIADTDRASVEKMTRAIKNAVKEVGTNRQDVILAALAETSRDIAQDAPPAKENKKNAS